MHEPRSFLPRQVQPLHWSVNALYNTTPFEGPMDPYDYVPAMTNLPSKSSYIPHYTQVQPQHTQYFQPQATQDVNLFDVNAFAALSPSSVGSFSITPSLSPRAILLPTDTPENTYARPSHQIPLPPTPFEAAIPHPQVALPATNRGTRRRRHQEMEDPGEEFLPAPKRRRCEYPNSSVALHSVPLVPGVPSATPAPTAQSFGVDAFLMDEHATSWAPSIRKRRSPKSRSPKRSEDASSTSTRGSASLSVIRASSAPLPDSKYGWLDHLLSSALEANKHT
jgi:hypothetical protein